jgi:F420-dependent oxidoreductase-like protein
MLRSAKLTPVFDYDVLERFWRQVDDLGYHAVWDYDHFYGLTDPELPTLEGWTTLAAMAAHTSNARVGCMVTGVTYRHPAVLANMAATVDHISHGRLEFGLGAAWHEGEHQAYGIDYPSPGTRIDMLDEACELIRRLWTEDHVSHQGRFWTLTHAMANPKPVQAHVPMVLGGAGVRRTLRVIAKHADEWNWSGSWDESGPKEFARLSHVLDEHCSAIGRDPKEIKRSFQLFVQPDDDAQTKAQLGRLDEYENAGADHVVIVFVSPPSKEQLASLAPPGSA